MAIPFKSLRFGDKREWGVNFVRGDAKNNSYHVWSPVPVQFRGIDLGYTGKLIWDKAPAKAKKKHFIDSLFTWQWATRFRNK